MSFDGAKMEDLIAKTEAYVKEVMSHNDASHDYAHVQRVLHWARKIEAAQRAMHPTATYNSHLITLASLLHDVDDRKYLPPNHPADSNRATTFLLSAGASAALAAQVQHIITHISYSHEVTHPPAQTALAIAQNPELAIVQDADRLDALGAIGIVRTVVFGAAMRPEQGFHGTLAHFDHKLENLPRLMKTEVGRREAEVRVERVRAFKEWWREEMGGVA